jgi:hypothetical protein
MDARCEVASCECALLLSRIWLWQGQSNKEAALSTWIYGWLIRDDYDDGCVSISLKLVLAIFVLSWIGNSELLHVMGQVIRGAEWLLTLASRHGTNCCLGRDLARLFPLADLQDQTIPRTSRLEP